MKTKSFFISGHVDATYQEFISIYAKAIKDAVTNYNASFYVGDCDGVDILNVNPNNVTVCHMLDKPMNINPKIINIIPNFRTHEDRDSFMTSMTDEDIAFIRVGKHDSGTAANILRRKTFQTNEEKTSLLFGN